MKADLAVADAIGEGGGVPPNWQARSLNDVADIRFSNVDKKTSSSELPVRLCNYTDVYFNDYITADMAFMRASATRSEIVRFGLLPGDVIITKDSETPDDIGVPTLVDSSAPDLLCGYHLAMLRPMPGRVDPAFLAKQLAHNRILRYFGRQANGSTRYGLSTGAIERTPLWLPSIDEQREIGRIARLLDDAIKRTEAAIAKLRRINAGLLRDLVTRGVDHNGRLRDPEEHPEQFESSSIGIVPRSWDAPTLASLCVHIGSGVTPRGGEEVYVRSGVLFIRSQNVTFEGLNLSDVAHIPYEIHLGMRRSTVRAHDVLFNITGASIGRCCAMPDALGEANVNQHVCILRVPDARECDALLLSAVLGSPIGQRQLEALNTCGNRQGLNYQQLGSFVVPWPCAEERKAIAAILACSASRIAREEATLDALRAIKSGMTHDLLSGEVPVTTRLETAEVP